MTKVLMGLPASIDMRASDVPLWGLSICSLANLAPQPGPTGRVRSYHIGIPLSLYVRTRQVICRIRSQLIISLQEDQVVSNKLYVIVTSHLEEGILKYHISPCHISSLLKSHTNPH